MIDVLKEEELMAPVREHLSHEEEHHNVLIVLPETAEFPLTQLTGDNADGLDEPGHLAPDHLLDGGEDDVGDLVLHQDHGGHLLHQLHRMFW